MKHRVALGSLYLKDDVSGAPWISFVVPAYNAEKTLQVAVESILGQSGASFEIIVVDDGSTDGTLSVAAALAARYDTVKVLTQTNAGTGAALNSGRGVACGEHICSVDADDELAEDYLATMRSFVDEYPGYDIYSHELLRVLPGGEESRVFEWDEVRSITFDEFLREGRVVGPGTIMRRQYLEALGGYSETTHNEDYELWLRAFAAGARHIYCPKPLYRYHQGLTQKTGDRLKVYQSLVEILEEFLPDATLSRQQREHAESYLAVSRQFVKDIPVYGDLADSLMESRAEAEAAGLRNVLCRLLGVRAAEVVLNWIHRISWIARPVRERLWRWRARVHHRRGSGA